MRLALGLTLALSLGCEPAREAPRVTRPVLVDASRMNPVTTDLDFEVTLSAARLVVSDFEFTTLGEFHTLNVLPLLLDRLVPRAYAHPGHYEGGQVIGEAPGRFVVDWFDDHPGELATATLLVGEYTSANFTFSRAEADDVPGDSDRLLGHTAILAGLAQKEDSSVAFEFTVDSPEDRLLVGARFQTTIDEDEDGEIGFRLLPHDEVSGETLFDGIDFALLDEDDDGQVMVGPTSTQPAEIDAYNQLRRTLQTHNHYDFAARATPGGNHGGAP